MIRPLAAAATALLLLLAGCDNAEPKAEGHPEGHHTTTTAPASKIPLRAKEKFLTLAMPEEYTPKAPTYGTDDYRCFLLDPKLTKPGFVTGVDVLPGNPDVVHHVILFQVPPDQVANAKAEDEKVPGEGWTCFGGAGMGGGSPGDALNRAPWIGAWAPGGGESIMAKDIGIPLKPGTQVIMQVHYNLLAGSDPDTSSAKLRIASGDKALKPLDTMLLVAPIELPCRPGHDENKLCDRGTAVADVTGRFGGEAGFMVGGLQLLCGNDPMKPVAGPTQHCDRSVQEAGTIRAIAGHMHLLGRRIKIELNPDTPESRSLLNIYPWNFDEQGSIPVKPAVHIQPGDTLRVTCTHSQKMRDLLPDLKGQPERYVVWGEGTTDEMCLGIVLLTRD